MVGLKEQWEAAPLWQRVLVVLIMPVVVIGAVWFYVIKPAEEEKDRLLSQREQIRQEIEWYSRMTRPQIIENLEKQLDELKIKEEEKRKELERVVGNIPTLKEMERVFGDINRIALRHGLVITRISLSEPRVQNFQLVERNGKKIVQVTVQQQNRVQEQQGRGRNAPPEEPQTGGVPIKTMEISMSLEGNAQSVYNFLRDVQRRGLLSYPKSLKIELLKEGSVSADVVIDVILQE